MNANTIDLKLLQAQRETLSLIVHRAGQGQCGKLTPLQVEHLQGLQNLLDTVQDEAADIWAGERDLKHAADRGHTYAETVETRQP